MVTPLSAPLVLTVGSHASRERGMCLMEAVAWVAGEPHTDHPLCASPVLAAFGRTLNDVLDDERRQELAPLVPLLVGSVDPAADQVDGLAAAHFLVSVWTPTWLELVPALADHAAALRALPEPATWDDVAAWKQPAAAARDAAWAAARDALQPTVDDLSGKTIDLYRRLVEQRARR